MSIGSYYGNGDGTSDCYVFVDSLMKLFIHDYSTSGCGVLRMNLSHSYSHIEPLFVMYCLAFEL